MLSLAEALVNKLLLRHDANNGDIKSLSLITSLHQWNGTKRSIQQWNDTKTGDTISLEITLQVLGVPWMGEVSAFHVLESVSAWARSGLNNVRSFPFDY